MIKPPNNQIEHIVEILKSRILKGEYEPGTKLSENMIAGEFECSRTPVREALKSLEQDHLVTILPHSGTYVRAVTDEENVQIMEIRAYLETLAFRLACEREADATVLKTLCEQMQSILDADEIDFLLYGRTHFLFHRHLVELSKNELLLNFYNQLNLNVSTRLIYNKMTKDEIDMTQSEHYAIVDALEKRDAETGESFMMRHLWRKRDALLNNILKREEA